MKNNDPTSEDDLRNLLQRRGLLSKLSGILRIGDLESAPRLPISHFFIIHLDRGPTDYDSGHWMLLMRADKNDYIIFDSYGIPVDNRIMKYLTKYAILDKDHNKKMLRTYMNTEDLQSLDTSLDSNQCGLYVISALEAIFKSKDYVKNFGRFLDSFKPDGGAFNARILYNKFA